MESAKQLKLIWKLWQHFGLRWISFRLNYAVQMRAGWLMLRTPKFEWSARPLQSWLKSNVPVIPGAYKKWRREHGGLFFFDTLPQIPKNVSWDTQSIINQADAILAGRVRYFEHTEYDVGYPPDWHVNPMLNEHLPQDLHWSQISDFERGDIKLVWEASRFGFVYTLVRAYRVTKDERYPDAFWTLVEDWAENNPPNMGPNWKCGQEATFRVMAWCFGLHGFADANSTTFERICFLAAMIAAHGERIERNIAFARSQKNNHAISEGVGLWTIGLLFPEFKRATHWRELGRRVIQEEIERQIYDDGAYVQHSMNYHRVILHDLLWALRLGEVNDHKLPESVYSKFDKAAQFLYQLLDLESGQVPNYGANDGALVLPLNTCGYLDYRPILQASQWLISKKRLFRSGPWDEDLLWLFGAEALDGELQETTPAQFDLLAPIGGYYTLRGLQSWAMIRCAEYQDRPSHADQLHLDLWWRGVNVACDAGTYLYNADDLWNNGLSGSLVHNTVSVDDKNQMLRASRFLWLDWAQGRVFHHAKSESGHLAYWEGMHDGYTRCDPLVMHRRSIVRLGSARWLIMDKVQSAGEHDYALQWLLPDFPYIPNDTLRGIELETPQGLYQVCTWIPGTTGQFSVVKAEEDSVRGWRSRYYAYKETALSLSLECRGSNILFLTLFSPPGSTLESFDHQITISWPSQDANITLGGNSSLVDSILLNGAVTDSLEL